MAALVALIVMVFAFLIIPPGGWSVTVAFAAAFSMSFSAGLGLYDFLVFNGASALVCFFCSIALRS